MPAFLAPLAFFILSVLSRLLAFLGRLFVGFKTSLGAWFVFLITMSLAPIVIQLLISLGIGFVTYNLGGYALDTLFDTLVAQFDGLPSDFLMFVYVARVDEAIAVLFGALTARLTLAGLTGSSLRSVSVFRN